MRLIMALVTGIALLIGFASGMVVSSLTEPDPIQIEGRFMPEDIAQQAYDFGFEDGRQVEIGDQQTQIDRARQAAWEEGYDAATEYLCQGYYLVGSDTRSKLPNLQEVCGR